MFIERLENKFFAVDPSGAVTRWEIVQWAGSAATREAYAINAQRFVRDGRDVSFSELIA